MYIDLSYYLGNGGTEMTDAAFSRVEYRARKIVDRFTQGRVKTMTEVPEAVQRLMVELITMEAGQGAQLLENQPVASFSNDGYSETYADPLTADRAAEIEEDLVLKYLSDETDDTGTPLLYLGVSGCTMH